MQKNFFKVSSIQFNPSLDKKENETLNRPLQKLLIIGYVWPEPNSSAAGTRMMQLINLFQQHGWEITFSSPAKLGEHKQNLTELGIKEQNIELNSTSFDQFLKSLQPDAVLFDRFMMEEQFGWRVEEHAPQAIRILNTEDLHSLRACRQHIVKAELKQNRHVFNMASLALTDKNRLFSEMAISDIAKREIASIFRSDTTLMISDFEMSLLKEKFQIPENELFYLPFIYASLGMEKLPEYEVKQHFVSIGNFRHDPNWDAVLWLKESIWPKIRQQIPNAELNIYGAYPPPKATALHNPKQGFLVKGWAEDAFKVIQDARVLLAPLRFGAGIKGKLAEAMLNGTPSITTPIGSEGMYNPDKESWPGMVAETAEEIANQAIALYQNKELWQEKQTIGFELAEQYFVNSGANEERAEQFIDGLNKMRLDLDNRRNENFIGAMLNHHHHKSTKFMAQWIEAKNSK